MIWPFFTKKANQAQSATPSGKAAAATHVLHVSIGPVQGFINEGRRTRDLWAGSFILSWLTGRAMAVVDDQNFVFPAVQDDAFYAAIYTTVKDKHATFDNVTSSLPNHFCARVPSSFDPNLCVKAVQAAWRALAKEVWCEFLEDVAPDAIHEVWEQQIGNGDVSPFWDVVWVKGPAPDDRNDLNWIDQRKQTRLPKPAYGGEGRMCTLMGGLTELGGRLPRDESRAFWSDLRSGVSDHLYGGKWPTQLELRDSERLCAIALVKRLFPILSEASHARAVGWAPKRAHAAEIHDEKVAALRVWPSTAHVAAGPWLARAGAVAQTSLAGFASDVRRFNYPAQVAESGCQVGKLRGQDWAGVDGRMFYAESAQELADAKQGEQVKPAAVAAWAKLREIRGSKADGERAPLGAPPQYFAIVAADGDNMGAALRGDRDMELPGKLAKFSIEARAAFADWGVALFAGGDDVLGFAPVDHAIDIACTLREAWRESVGEAPTLSVAISFVHVKHVLRWGLASTRALLDEVAKEGLGRDALAIRIQRGGSDDPVWAAKWADFARVDALKQLLSEPRAANAFTYKMIQNAPWAWSAHNSLLEGLAAISTDRASGIPATEDAELSHILAAAGRCTLQEAEWIVGAGRLLPGETSSPLSPALLALVRFMELHRQPSAPKAKHTPMPAGTG